MCCVRTLASLARLAGLETSSLSQVASSGPGARHGQMLVSVKSVKSNQDFSCPFLPRHDKILNAYIINFPFSAFSLPPAACSAINVPRCHGHSSLLCPYCCPVLAISDARQITLCVESERVVCF